MLSYQALQELVAIDSPTGYTQKAAQYIHHLLGTYGWKPQYTNKQAVTCALGSKPRLAIAAHTDTLGAIVSRINADGTLGISLLGGPLLNSFEGEYCRIYTLADKVYTGTLLLNNPSTHVNAEAAATKRDIGSMHIRIDEPVQKKADTEQLGIQVGDIICFDTRYQELPSGYIKSRFMDNKAGCFVLFEIARRMAARKQHAPVELFFSNYEEVGHGGSGGYAATIEELLVIDMGVVGTGCEGNEQHCSICAKDSSGPYDYQFRKKLVQLAETHQIPCKIDIYPYYGSDGSAALRAGNDFRVALIGPGVAASHGMERTHKKGIEATIDLCMAYINQL
ncbi:glucanase [Sphingobacteriales bacterium UPWRP_1]|nr:glucanase [Sphingobacteriales bacterium TSM_CSM]PSJ75254.1 glucanase [Sphingobacteriales bacterium UPWRP_1]